MKYTRAGGVSMNALERLEDEACKDGIDVVHWNFESDRVKGLYCDGVIGINSNLDSSNEEACILAEELGHHYTTYGNILDQSDAGNRKQELLARTWAYDKMIGLSGIISCYEHGCCNRYEMAEYLGVTEEFLDETIERYRSKYGAYVGTGKYIIYFEPNLTVCKMIR